MFFESSAKYFTIFSEQNNASSFICFANIYKLFSLKFFSIRSHLNQLRGIFLIVN